MLAGSKKAARRPEVAGLLVGSIWRGKFEIRFSRDQAEQPSDRSLFATITGVDWETFHEALYHVQCYGRGKCS
jgi:hypothetical protein